MEKAILVKFFGSDEIGKYECIIKGYNSHDDVLEYLQKKKVYTVDNKNDIGSCVNAFIREELNGKV